MSIDSRLQLTRPANNVGVLKYKLVNAALAQLVEQLLRKEKVNSSIPLSGTISSNLVIWWLPDDIFLAC